MKKGKANIGPLLSPRGDHAPVGAEPESQFRREGQFLMGQQPLLRQFEHDQKQQRLVGRRIAAGPVDFQLRKLGELLI